ncbi:MAG: hypothetical protein ACRCZF_12545, partial [Gemmataceae bacterium]
PTGKQFYQLNYGPPAESYLKEAIQNNYDKTQLSRVSQQYFHTKAGARATLLLANLQLDLGNYIESSYSFDRLLNRTDSEELFTPMNLFRAIVALKRAGAGTSAKSNVPDLLARLEKKYPRDGLTIGKRSYSIDELKTELNRPIESLFGTVGEAYVMTRYGNASHTGLGEGSAPLLDPSLTLPMLYRTVDNDFSEGANWVRQNLGDLLKNVDPTKGQSAIPSFFPVTAQNLVIYRTYDGVYARITKDGFSNHGKPSKSGDIYWIANAKGALSPMMGGARGQDKTLYQGWWNNYRNLGQASILYENTLVGTLAHDGTNVYFVDDFAVPLPTQQNQNDFGMPVVAAQSAGGVGLSDTSQLVSVNIHKGNIDWVLGITVPGPVLSDEQDDQATNPLQLMQGAYFLGPPLPLNGKLYVLFEKRGKMRIACLDPGRVGLYQGIYRHPELIWSQRLGEPNTALPADTYRRFQCSFLTYADGILICPTNSGSIVAIDIMSRSLLWAQSYRFIKQQVNEENMPRRVGRIVQMQQNSGA